MKLAISDLASAKSMTDVNPSQSGQICGGFGIINIASVDIEKITVQRFQEIRGEGSLGIVTDGYGDVTISSSSD